MPNGTTLKCLKLNGDLSTCDPLSSLVKPAEMSRLYLTVFGRPPSTCGPEDDEHRTRCSRNSTQ